MSKLKIEKISKKKAEEIEKDNRYQSGSIRAELFEAFKSLKPDSDAVAIPYGEDVSKGYLKSLLNTFNREEVDKRKGKLSYTDDSDNNRLVIQYKKK